jgi:hypothetical protein
MIKIFFDLKLVIRIKDSIVIGSNFHFIKKLTHWESIRQRLSNNEFLVRIVLDHKDIIRTTL